MPRRQPTSTKQKKAQMQLKRAIKRGDVEAPEPTPTKRKTKGKGGRPNPNALGSSSSQNTTAASALVGVTTRKLESRFMKLDKEWLEHARYVASTTRLPRPVPFEEIVLDTTTFLPDRNGREIKAATGASTTGTEDEDKDEDEEDEKEDEDEKETGDKESKSGGKGPASRDEKPTMTMYAPKRPKWRYDQTKKEVEKNEEGLFSRWLKEMDVMVDKWQTSFATASEDTNRANAKGEEEGGKGASSEEIQVFKRSPTYFERNLEVWRQLWRVTEISQILLILLDCRAPTLHFPTSLQNYLKTLRPPPKVILILTKVDLVTPSHVEAWTNHFSKQNPEFRIVHVESYKERHTLQSELNDGKGKRTYLDPHIPPSYLQGLVSALKGAYNELLTPPPSISNPSKWKPPVREGVDWDEVIQKGGHQADQDTPNTTAIREHSSPDNKVGNGEVDSVKRLDQVEGKESGHTVLNEAPLGPGAIDDRMVTVGLIGQPNVGKSSLLNALFGARRVRASKTPGKTKHFQTLFWTPEIRLVDCPGLVFPGFVPMEMQVLAGVLPISQMASIPSSAQFIGQKMPLEKIFGLEHPSRLEKAVEEDKRTWRPGMKTGSESKSEEIWTAMDVLTAYGLRRGWKTAKAGRPDVNRAGNAILRACADGKNIRWGFWPPGTERHEETEGNGSGRNGIWITSAEGGLEPGQWDDAGDDSDDEDDLDDSESESTLESGLVLSEEDDSESGNEPQPVAVAGGGRFGALASIDESDGDSDDL
ncbi:hypothetical protein FRC18_004972 [Serendipita sp. 400]|nr:hypothetical protein FRC18_004972 [Serendipita sp. 400]